MSSARWPAGTLREALKAAHASWPHATAPQLARAVGCEPGCARVILRGLAIDVPKGKPQRIIWTDPMKAALVDGARSGTSVTILAEQIGVTAGTLTLGALEVIRELAA